MNQNSLAVSIGNVMPLALRSGLFVSLCTIQRPDGTLGATGAPSGAYVDVPGLVSLKCQNAVPTRIKIMATEVKTVAQIAALNFHHCLLGGHYPQIEENWRAVVDGIDYDILGVENDSQGQMTRLELQLVEV